jgi:hypothetical protein
VSDHVVFEPITQKSDDDCAIACLAMLLGLPYATVRGAAPRSFSKGGGLTTRQIVRLAAKLGTPVMLTKDFTGDDVGILDLDRAAENGGGHVAMFIKGVVYTTASGHLWADLDAYLAYGRFTLLGLIRRA